MKTKKRFAAGGLLLVAVAVSAAGFAVWAPRGPAQAAYHFANFSGKPPIHILRSAQKSPTGITPAQIKQAYNLPAWGGQGTIAIIDAYDAPNIESDLAVFSQKFGLAPCTTKGDCFEKHKMADVIGKNAGWGVEASLDVEWAHAIAPQAKILLVEAKTQSGANLLAAIDYATSRKDVVAVSMSWGGAEFPEEVSMDTHFTSKYGAVFFTASGDNGTGVSWPAASPNVVAVGGTSITLQKSGAFASEIAWKGSGGGVSAYEPEPDFQKAYNIARAGGHRAVPDVAYNADPKLGYPIYRTIGAPGDGWYTVGGTSAGAPQWAAIHALHLSVSLPKLYSDKASLSALTFFRDIVSGANGTCKYFCSARARYDYVTGLGSPQTSRF